MTQTYALALRCLLGSLLCTSMLGAAAAPGAHGPDGEHLDAPNVHGEENGAAPRFEASSETFELVGRLRGGELSLLINRYETNEPVLQAQVELESGELKTVAQFHSDMGDYAVADEAFLHAVQQPGAHPIVVTVVAGEDADLLEGTLTVASAAGTEEAHHDHGHEPEHEHSFLEELAVPLGVTGSAALLGAGGWFFYRRRNDHASRLGGRQ